MKALCAWCRRVLRAGPLSPVSNGICQACLKRVKETEL